MYQAPRMPPSSQRRSDTRMISCQVDDFTRPLPAAWPITSNNKLPSAEDRLLAPPNIPALGPPPTAKYSDPDPRSLKLPESQQGYASHALHLRLQRYLCDIGVSLKERNSRQLSPTMRLRRRPQKYGAKIVPPGSPLQAGQQVPGSDLFCKSWLPCPLNRTRTGRDWACWRVWARAD